MNTPIWKPKSENPPTAGWYYVRAAAGICPSAVYMRYYDGDHTWFRPSFYGFEVRDDFTEWLLIPGLEQIF